MSATRKVIIEALTRSTVRRDRVGLVASDEELTLMLNPARDRQTVEYLSAISKLLRLLDAFLVGRETGEGLADKYFVAVRALRQQFGTVIGDEQRILETFDQEAQLFSPDVRHGIDVKSGVGVPALLDADQLRQRVENTYELLKQWWESALRTEQ